MSSRHDSVVDRLGRDGRRAAALSFLLGRDIPANHTKAVRCLNSSAHRNGDKHPSMIVKPDFGRVTCAACGLDAGLLEVGVLRGMGATECDVAELLDQHIYGGGTAEPVITASLTSVSTGGSAMWPYYADTARRLGWEIGRERDGRTYMRLTTELADGEPGRVKVRYEKSADNDTATFVGPKLPIGLIVDDLFRDAIAGDAIPTIVLLAGETDLLAWAAHARDEGVLVAAFSLANGEAQSLGELAKLLQDCHVIVIYDNDDVGRREGTKRAEEARAAGAASAVSIHVPNPHNDVCDYLRAGGSVTQLLKIAKGADTERSESASDDEVSVPDPRIQTPQLRWQPFPVDVLPSPIRELVTETATAQGSDPSLVAVPALAAIASAIGNSQCLLLKPGWSEPSVLWTATVADSGTLKSPAYDAAVGPLRRRQNEALRRHRDAEKEHAVRKARYAVDFAEWKKRKGEGDPPETPEEPQPERLIVEDITMEALSERLVHAPRGMLLAREELAGWFLSFDQYRGGRGGDEARWLSIHRAGSITTDRKSGDRRTTHIERAAVSVTGTVQPSVLRTLLGDERFDSGLAARFLFACPPRRRKTWNERTVSAAVLSDYDSLFGKLLDLRPTNDDDGLQAPAPVRLSPEAKRLWIEFYNCNAERTLRASGRDAALFSKIEAAGARFAVIFYLVKSVTTDDYSFTLQIDAESMRSAIALADWFAHEALRLYATFQESGEERSHRELVEWLQRRGGTTTAAVLARQGLRRYRGKGKDALAALEALASAGLGTWRGVPTTKSGGRPTREFVLTAIDAADDGYADTEPKPPQSASNPEVAYPQVDDVAGEAA